MKPTLGFINHVSKYPDATAINYQSLRYHHPNDPVIFNIDGKEHWYPYNEALLDEYGNTEFIFHKNSLGYPPYTTEKVLEFLKRIYISVLKLNTDYFCHLEDDCYILNELTVNPEWEIAGHVITHGNNIPIEVIRDIEYYLDAQFFDRNIKLKTNYYGAGGGTIMKSKTFLDNYDHVTTFIEKNWKEYLNFYSPSGYLDCFMVLYYMLCGKEYTPNPNIYNIFPEDRTSTMEELVEKYKDKYQLVHNWKKYYGT